MMVYRTATRQVDPSLELSRCLTMPAEDAEAMTSRLLGIGSMEVALSDLWAPHRDGRDPRVLALSTATRCAARTLVDAHAAPVAAADTAERHLRRAVSACLRLPLPRVVDLHVPEGFAYNAVHPLAYAAAAADCLRRWRPSRVAILGLRDVGATLAAAVAAQCEREGVPTWSGTLRPHGPPFDRVCLVDEVLASEIAAQRGALCLVVDEGPVRSGSSIVSAAGLFEANGHPAARIVMLCSRDPLPSTLRSARARERWSAFVRVVVPLRGPDFAEDWSGGAWRQHVLPSLHWPPVHPQHERRKGVPVDAPGELRKFVGLGQYGTVVFRRAMRTAEAGFGVPVFGLQDGYLRMARLSPASVMSRRGTRALAEAVMRYLPWRAAAMQTGARADTAAMMNLLRVNTQERFGPAHDTALLRLERVAREAAAQPAVILDGHLAPWEWLQTPQGVVKVDTAEHGDDHFQPGPQDIAWDVAGVLAEFAWTAPERASLIQRLSAAMKDPGLGERLRWMRPCYLAARLGYDTMAAESLGDTADGRGFGRQARRFGRQLAATLPS